MKKTFILNLIILLVLNLLIKPFWIFGIDRSVQNHTGAQEYGMYFSLLGLAMVLNIILDAGITNFNNRAVARNHSRAGTYLASLSALKFVLGIVYALICLLVGYLVGYSSRQMYLLLFLAVNQFLQSMVTYLRSNVSGMQLYITDSFLSVLDKTLMILLCATLLWGPWASAFTIEWFAYAQTVATLLTVLVAGAIVVYYGRPLASVNVKRWIPILRSSLPYALLVLLMAFYNRIDGVMLERIYPDGKHEAGLYAQGFRLLDAVQMIGYLFAGLLLPMFSRMIRSREPLAPLVRMAYTIIMSGAVVLIAGCWFYRGDLTQLMYPGASGRSALILALLMTSFGGIATTYIFGTLLTAHGDLKALNRMAAVSLGLNILLNFILIPKFGAIGSAVASVSTQWFSAGVQIYLSVRKINIGLRLRDAFAWLLLPAGAFATVFFAQMSGIHWFAGFTISGIAVFAVAILSRQLEVADIIRFVTKKGK